MTSYDVSESAGYVMVCVEIDVFDPMLGMDLTVTLDTTDGIIAGMRIQYGE